MIKNDKGMIVVIEGPSGVGKDSVMRGLMQLYPDLIEKIPSYTTREKRHGESDGDPYYFITNQEFVNKVKSGDIFEYTTRHESFRGMSRNEFDRVINNNKIPIKDCDKFGLKALKKIYGDRVFGIFLTAPKLMIKERLMARGEGGTGLQKRLANYEEHIKQREFYNVSVENIILTDAIDRCYYYIEKYYDSLN